MSAATVETQSIGAEAVRGLYHHLAAQAQRSWTPGGIPGLHEAPFLLSFLRQLSEQGWGLAQGIPLPREEDASIRMRGLRDGGEFASPSHQRGLEGQSLGEPSDTVHFLSSLLARHAQEEWGRAYEAHAESRFVLAHNARSRVGRLRAYGNAIVAPVAQAFIEAYLGARA